MFTIPTIPLNGRFLPGIVQVTQEGSEGIPRKKLKAAIEAGRQGREPGMANLGYCDYTKNDIY